ncbi:MAG TPA: hypothetical protein VMV79_08700, partial [Alphaproteobacteria bacterium]|nr:hypothetical protein [Alphaproteobacteria bacterium]
MADIPPASAPSSATPSAPAAPAGGVTAVGAVVNSTPDKIQNLERQIQVSGLIAAAPDAGTVTVNTAIGPLTLLLPHLAQAQQDKLLQQLLAMFQGQKPVTVLVEPGNPPAQAFLLLPSNVAGAQGAAPETMPPPNAPVFDAVSIRGAVLAAVVLPQDISLPSLSPPPFSPGLASSTPYDAPSVYSSSGQNAAAHF